MAQPHQIVLSVLILLALSGCSTGGSAYRPPPNARTDIMGAALEGNLTQLERAITRGEDVNTTDDKGDTPLHLAAEHGHDDVARYLVEYGAAIDATNAKGVTPLHRASGMGDYVTAQLLIERNASIRASTDFGDTPLHLAAEMRNFEMAQMEKSMGFRSTYNWKTDNLKVAELLLRHGADVNARNKLGRTPLQRTTPWNYLPMTRLLVEHGADTQLEDNDGMSPLQHAIEKGARDVARYLESL